MNGLLLVGLNHTTAPLALRESLALSPTERGAVIESLRSKFAGSEVVLLSTCNRVELYFATERDPHEAPESSEPAVRELIDVLAQARQLEPGGLYPHIYSKAGRDAVGHLFRVTCGLDSMVLGETQILGQVRQAYEFSRDRAATGSRLNPLFQKGLSVARQVLSQTPLAEGRVSVASVAVDYASQVFETLSDKTVVAVGAGKMGLIVLRGFAAQRPGRLVLCNRDFEKARAHAEKFAADAAPLTDLEALAAQADVMITSTGSDRPLLTRKAFEPIVRHRRGKPIFLIDIALPRDVEPSVGQIEGVYLYNLDDLQKVVAASQSQRSGAAGPAMAIVESAVEEFFAWHRARQNGPLIDDLFKRGHALARQELERTMARFPNMPPEDRAHLEDLARRIVNKLVHDRIKSLREAHGAVESNGSNGSHHSHGADREDSGEGQVTEPADVGHGDSGTVSS
jgi:glutamyl-tRNA reductase